MMNTQIKTSKEYQATLRREKFKATAIWNDLVNQLHRHVVVKKRRCKMKTYENCFPGSDAISVLQTYVTSHPDLRHSVSRAQLRSLCQIFVQKRILESVEGQDDFEDSNKLYRFVDMPYSKAGPDVHQDLNRYALKITQMSNFHNSFIVYVFKLIFVFARLTAVIIRSAHLHS